MEEINEVYDKYVQFSVGLFSKKKEFQQHLDAILYGPASDNQPLKDMTNLTPQPEKKRAKRLAALDEYDENNASNNTLSTKNSVLLEVTTDAVEQKILSPRRSPRSSTRSAQKALENLTISKTVDTIPKTASDLMPPPSVPAVVSSSISDQSYSRPQRAAKLDCKKHLKEPTLTSKLRRPTTEDLTGVKIKVEQEQRASQLHEAKNLTKAGDTTASTVSQDSITFNKKTAKRVDSTASSVSHDSVIVLPTREVSIVSISSEIDSTTTARDPENKKMDSNTSAKNLRVRIKREKMSGSFEQTQSLTEMQPVLHPKETETTTVESSMAASVLSTTEINPVNTTQNKKPSRKKKVIPKPIKVERLSDAVDTSVASRTRKKDNSIEKNKKPVVSEQLSSKTERNASVYEEALENLRTSKDNNGSVKTMADNSSAAVNETVNITKQVVTPTSNTDSTMILGTAPNDATYCTASAATFILEAQSSQPNQFDGNDLTFNVAAEKATQSQHSSIQSMETARDTLQPNADSIMTEDESFVCPETPVPTVKKIPPQAPIAPKVPAKSNAVINSAKTLPMPNKTCKMPTRTIEIFNPLVQSPVKKKVEAYENVAAAQAASAASAGTMKRTRSKLTKENILPTLQSSSSTPTIGKLPAPTIGRFLTPNQSSNATVTPNIMAQNKKIPASASKAQTLTKSNSAGNLKTMTSSAKAPSRENSNEDFRKGLHQMAEERKKQREQKHLLAAQQREAKERERAERMAKVAKEREEKRLKKQQEAEQKRRELEEIQKKLRAQEENAVAEIAKHKAKVLMEQEKALLQQMKPLPGSAKAKPRMPPPQPKTKNKYTFEMLHEDDSTDDEKKISHKRPPPPEWSRSEVRGASILKQQVMPAAIVDSFFSVQPMTPDLKLIFPAIDPRYLKRNSSVLWSTPPRYSELPKY